MSFDPDAPAEKLRGHTAPVTCLYGCGTRLYSGSEDGTVRLWDLESKRSIRRLSGTGGDVSSIALHPSSPDVLYVASGQAIALYDLRQSDRILVMEPSARKEGQHQDDINKLAISESGHQLLAADDAGDVMLYSLPMLDVLKVFPKKHENLCSSALFRPGKSDEVISCGMDYRVLCFNTTRGKNLVDLHLLNSKDDSSVDDIGGANACFNPPLVHDISVSPDSSLICAGRQDGVASLIHIERGKFVGHLANGHQNAISSTVFDSSCTSGWKLITAGIDGNICSWKLKLKTMSSTAGRKGRGQQKGGAGLFVENQLVQRIVHGDKIGVGILTQTPSMRFFAVGDLTSDITLYRYSEVQT